MLNNFSIGVDIGGSHISCAAVDLQNRKILRETLTELPVDNKGEAEDIIDTWSDAIRRCMGKLDASQLKGIGFAMPLGKTVDRSFVWNFEFGSLEFV